MPAKTKKTSKVVAPTQTVIQINVYRYKNDKLQFLMFKRIDDDNDHFWQPLSLAVQEGEPLDESLKRAAEEQAGITELHYLSHELYSYGWFANGQKGRDIVFAAEVAPKTLVFPDLKHFERFAWMPYKEALLKLTWDGNKQSLRQLMDHIEEREKLASMPAPQTKPKHDEQAVKPIDKKAEKPEKNTEDDIPYEHRSTKDLSDELMPRYENDEEDGDSTRVFPL